MMAHVLLVEDNAATRKFVRCALTQKGYLVSEATDGRSAVNLMARTSPDLIIQNLLLPDIDGFELIGQLRSQPRGKEIPILAFSGLMPKFDGARISAAGFDDLVVKPIQPSRLLEIVRAHLPVSGAAPSSLAKGRRIVLVDHDAVRLKLVRCRLEYWGFQVVTAVDGSQALDRARSMVPDAIVSDVATPGLDGFALCLAVREAPELSRVPVILLTSSYPEGEGRRRGDQAGVSALVLRSAELSELLDALRTHVNDHVSPVSVALPEVLESEKEQMDRIAEQLERQVAMNAGLAHRNSVLAAELSVVSGMCGALARSQRNIQCALGEVLASCLDAGGISQAAIYIPDGAGGTALQVQHGFQDHALRQLESLLVQADRAVTSRTTDTPLDLATWESRPDSAAGLFPAGQSASFLPLVFGQEHLGVLLLVGQPRGVPIENWQGFGRAMASQIAVALALTKAFTELGAAEQRRRVLMECAADAIFVSTASGVLMEVNQAGERLLGRTRHEMVGRLFLEFVSQNEREGDPASVTDLAFCMGAGPRSMHVVSANGCTIPVEVSTGTAQLGRDKVVVSIVRDVTERNAIEERLRESQKLDAIGRLALGVAHDFNNLLAVISSYAELITRAVTDESVLEDVHEISLAAERASFLTKHLLSFSQTQVLKPVVLDLNEVVTEMMKWLGRIMGDNIKVESGLEPHLDRVKVDHELLDQVFLNLVVNARDAMPAGGKLTIQTANVHLGATLDGVRSVSGPYVALSVSDTGAGMHGETMAHAFEPFFTTKKPGAGTGLGLATVHGIVKQSGGYVSVVSALGRGTTFTIYLPRVEKALSSLEAKRQTPSSHPPPLATILVVEDDVAVRDASVRILRGEGYQVAVARSVEDALNTCERRDTPIELVLTATIMSGMSGPALAAQMRGRRPDLKVLFMSGYADGTLSERMLGHPGSLSVEKPFTPETLAQKVREALDPGPLEARP